MKKNKTEYFPSDIIRFIPSTHIKMSKQEKKKQIEDKIKQELNSNNDEFKNKLKRSLQKNEITKEIYLSKNVSKDKRCQPNLLISQIDNSEKFTRKKKKFLAKISKENEYFLKKYKELKNKEEKMGNQGSQQKYLNDVIELYKRKNYNIKDIWINDKDNIFNYSVLTDLDFGNDVNNDLIRIIQENGYDDYLKEQNIIFNFKNELLKGKAKNKIKYPGPILIKFKINKGTDHGIDDVSKIKGRQIKLNLEDSEENNEEKKEEVNKINSNEYFKEKNENQIINNQNIDNSKNSNLYLQIKNDIQQDKKNKLNFYKVKNEYKNEKLVKFKESFKSNFSINDNNSFNSQLNENEKINENADNENKEKENPVLKYNNTELSDKMAQKIKPILILNKDKKKQNKKITFIKSMNMKRFPLLNKLPDINKSFINSRNEINKKFIGNNITNYSINKSELKTQEQKLKNNLIENGNDIKDNNKIIDIKKDYKISINSLFNNKISKIPMKENEFKMNLEKFKNKKASLYNSFLNNSNNINIQRFTNHFQGIIQEKNFGNIYNKNRYLKKHNFNHLISNDLLSDDENEGRNVQKVDKKIKNIIYDSADYLLGNYIVNKSEIIG